MVVIPCRETLSNAGMLDVVVVPCCEPLSYDALFPYQSGWTQALALLHL